MKTVIKDVSAWAGVLALLAFASAPSSAQGMLKVMRQGLGNGTVQITAGMTVTNCTSTCEQAFVSPMSVSLQAVSPAGTAFVKWDGDCALEPTTTCNLTMTAARNVRAVFRQDPDVPALTGDFTPENIQLYLDMNPGVTTAAQFMRALPEEYRKGWILMSRSESLQTGTARFPRVMLPSQDSRYVFTVGLSTHASYPGSHPNAIEFMQWDQNEKNFRFHEIVLAPIGAMGRENQFPARSRGVSVDEQRCTRCHSTRNIRNPDPSDAGTTGFPAGLVKAKNKPNWDTYDSWGGMLPFNRDSVFKGSVEAAALRKLLNPWTWSSDEPSRRVMELLELQSNEVGTTPTYPADHVFKRLSGGPNDGHIHFAFDGPGVTVLSEPTPTGTDTGPINYEFDGVPGAPPGGTNIKRNFDPPVILHAFATPASGEGRGVQLFDQLAGGDGGGNFNQLRIGNELANHRFATGSVRFDARPLALAINESCLVTDDDGNLSTTGGADPLDDESAFFDARNGMTLADVIADTALRSRDLTRRKADIQKLNLNRDNDNYLVTFSLSPDIDLISEYGPFTDIGTGTDLTRLRQEIFRRAPGQQDESIMEPQADPHFYVDRESYGYNTNRVALFRYFLEPLGVSVDKWSVSVRGRSRAYTFADVYGSYVAPIRSELQDSLTLDPYPGLTTFTCDKIIEAVNNEFARLPDSADMPTYTDIQRIFNKSCIECHGGLDYPPFANFSAGPSGFDLSEREDPPSGDRLADSYDTLATNGYLGTSSIDSYLFARIDAAGESCPYGSMPCGGPKLSQTDIETVRRWLDGAAPKTEGDPHILTIDDVAYDFQSAGEFTLLRGQGFELQARHTPVATDGPLPPNGHTGLSSCASLNTAAAMRVGPHRVTYQPGLSGRPNPEGLELRIDGKLVPYPGPRGIILDGGGRIMPTTASGGIQVQFPGGTEVIVTPGFWAHYQVWYLNINVRSARATFGIMGSIAPGGWLPALRDGSTLGPRPASLAQRFDQIYVKFADSWRVTKTGSLFDYGAGLTTDDFTLKSWPGFQPTSCKLPKDWTTNPELPKKQTPEYAKKVCARIVDPIRRENCAADVILTGDANVANTYLATEKIERNIAPAQVALGKPAAFDTKVGSTAYFNWKLTGDKDAGKLTYLHCLWPQGTKFTMKACRDLADGTEGTSVSGLEAGKFYLWKVLVEDGQGATVSSETRKFQVQKR